MKIAERLVQEGKYAEAEAICREILSDRYDPNCRPAMSLLAQPAGARAESTARWARSSSRKVEEVRKLLVDADGYYNSGRYDLAFKKYEQILNLDPYNTAARRGQEKINNQKTRYGEEAYNETRSRSLWEVQKGWERPVKQYGAEHRRDSTMPRPKKRPAPLGSRTSSTRIIIPRIEFRDASIREAMDFLRQQAAANDPAKRDARVSISSCA